MHWMWSNDYETKTERQIAEGQHHIHGETREIISGEIGTGGTGTDKVEVQGRSGLK